MTQETTLRDRIERVLATPGVVDLDLVVELHEEYALTCTQLRQKARRCKDLLQRDQQAKAEHLAREEPDLRRMLQEVDFDGVEAWHALCQECELSPPSTGTDFEDVQLIVVVLYEHSIHKQRQGRHLQKILRTFRRMSLGQAPVSQRLLVVREICREMPKDQDWQSDLKDFERARVEEMATEARGFAKGGNRAAMEAMLLEARSPVWSEKPAKQFLDALERLVQPLRRKEAEEQYVRLSGEIREAHAAMNEQQSRELQKQWGQVGADTGVQPSTQLAEEATPTWQWLKDVDSEQREQGAYKSACNVLEKALDDEAGFEELERCAAEVLRFDRGMPKLLAARYASRSEGIHRTKKRKFALVLSCSVLVLLLAGTAVTWAVLANAASEERARWGKQILAAVDREDFEGADRLFVQVKQEHPDVANSPECEMWRRRLAEARGREEARKSQYQALVDTARQGLNTPIGSNALKADWDRLGALLGPLDLTKGKVAKVAKTALELGVIADLREAIQARQDELIEKRYEEAKKAMATLEQLYTELREKSSQRRWNEVPVVGSRVTAAALSVTRDSWGLLEAQKLRAISIQDDVHRQTTYATQKVDDRREIEQQVGQIRRSHSRHTDLAKELGKFADPPYAAHPLAEDFVRASSLLRCWDVTAEWRKLTRVCRLTPRVSSAKSAKDRARALTAFLTAHPASLYEKSAREYLKYLDKASTALTTEGLTGLRVLRRILNDPLLQDVKAIWSDGRCYYVPQDAQLKASMINNETKGWVFSYYADSSLTERRGRTETSVRPQPKMAPQCEMTKELLKQIRLLENGKGLGWETHYLQLAEAVITSRRTDAILRNNLLRMLLNSAAETSPFHSAKIRRKHASLTLMDAPWMDPMDSDAGNMRPRAKRALEQIGSLTGLIKQVKSRVAVATKGLVCHRPVGIYMKSEGGVILETLPRDGRIFCMRKKPDGVFLLQHIGAVKDGKGIIDEPSLDGLYAGSLIFMEEE